MHNLSTKDYSNRFISTFPGDKTGSTKPRPTPGVLYSKAPPTPVSSPRLLAWSDGLAQQLGILPPSEEDLQLLAGNYLTPSMYPYAACYAGHQFGQWAGQLGDGRAITLGEWKAPDGKFWEIQLKGAGPTAYSRRADGRAVLRSSVREYLMSEAMHYLGVPTTRALSLVTTGDQVLRDMFYNGNPAYEQGAIVMRTSPSFLRFGSFEMLAARKETDHLRQLTNWTIAEFYPHLTGSDALVPWFKELVEKTATLMVEWLRVGFVHGVMNTDNMSILGLTIDYGPFSFLDDYDPNFTPNTTDLPGRRYAFGKQASIGYWNLGRLASALALLLPDPAPLLEALKSYENIISEKYYSMMANKLGLQQLGNEESTLIAKLEKVLTMVKPDMTLFYQLLIELPLEEEKEEVLFQYFQDSFYKQPTKEQASAFTDWLHNYIKIVSEANGSREAAKERMRQSNPRFILRNYLLHQAIEELEKGEDTLFKKLQQAIKAPYSAKFDELVVKRPEWASQKAGCSMLSCSS